jgi:heptose-I-phosphate ethanolaminephosphotransferase
MFKHFRINPLEWLGYLFAPIQKNSAFFVFMYALGWMCTQLEITLHLKGAKPYELSAPELFLDIYAACVVLALIPRKVRYWVRALLYVVLYSVALIDMFCYVKFESTLTPTMLMLFNETTKQESEEFLASYLNWEVITSYVGWILLLILTHIVWIFLRKQLGKMSNRIILPKVNDIIPMACKAVLGIVVAWLLVDAYNQCWDNKEAMKRLFSHSTIGQVEHELTRKDRAELYLPIYRLMFSVYANNLADHQIVQLEASSQKVQIDSCSYRVPNIVLVIGESYNKHHSQLYGYNMPTTPRQVAIAKEGSLVPFTDVVAPWNLTSYVFKNILSLQAVGDSAEWCDYPLFPEVFRKAGYHVTFITNQFQSKANEAVYDFSGGFFLNNPELSNKLFDTRNNRLHPFDAGVLQEYDNLKKEDKEHNLIILHLMGSHLMYKARYPQKTRKFLQDNMYDRPELTKKQRMILADYDNSVRYNDSIVWAVTQRFVDKDAVVIYMPDHAEEIFDGEPYMYGRMHSANIDYRLARNEMEIPFWIWGSPKYRENHPYGWAAIQQAKNRPMMTDVISHLLMYFGGIYSPLYHEEYNIVSPAYNTKRPRILKGVTDYNQLKKQ